MAFDVVTYALCKKYVKKSLEGAGALKGDAFTYEDFTPEQLAALKGADGKSAYQIAVSNGFTGTEKEWLASLKGDAFTYEDFTTEQLEALKGPKGEAFTYSDFTPEQLESLKGPKGDAFTYADFTAEQLAALKGEDGKDYTITFADYEAIAEKVKVPTKTSELTNDSGYITLKDVPEYSNKIEDVKVNGVSVVENKIANITLSDLDTTMGRSFTTDITVGHLTAGTTISATDKVADILYRILYASTPTANTVDLYFGGADTIPTTSFNPSNLDHLESAMTQDPDTLISNGYTQIIKTGNVETEEGQYPTIICTKSSGVKLVNITKLVTSGLTAFPLTPKVVETDNYTIYYLSTATYDEHIGGTEYALTFEEV